MKRKLHFPSTFLFVFFILLGVVPVLGQSPDPEASHEAYNKLPRESLYMHLNKSSYVEGDEIWFSGYVYNRQTGSPFIKTTNIHVGVYDSAGNLKSNYLHLARDGYFKGNVLVDSTFAVGDYYLRAATKWMKNFKEDDSYVQKIRVVDPSVAARRNTEVTVDYDVQFLPEGGNLIAGIYNNVGIKVLNDKGYGVKVTDVEVFDSNNNQITYFDTSTKGMAKFELRPELGVRYSAKIRFPEGGEQWYDLPLASPEGINIRLNLNPHQGKIGVEFAMNAQTYNDVGGESFYFLLHKERDRKRIPVVFDPEKFSASFFLKEGELHSGVNTITLFNEANRPVLERLFFVSDGVKRTEPGVQLVAREKDSLAVGFTSAVEGMKLSVSVLPTGTMAYNHQDNILSNFYLKPYVRGFIENPRYYFVAQSKKKEYELDLLLLTQGWSRYRWQDIQQGTPKQIHPFEDGIVLRGSINGLNPKFDGQLLVYRSQHHGEKLLPITAEENDFLVTSFFPENGERLYFSLLDENGRASKPGMYSTFWNSPLNDKLTTFWNDNSRKQVLYEKVSGTEAVEGFIRDKTIKLPEVVVSDAFVDSRPSPESNVFVPMFLKEKITPVTSRMVEENLTFADYLFRLGYDIMPSFSGNSAIRSRRGLGVNIIVDDIPQQFNLQLVRLPMGQIESFFVDRLSRYQGGRGGASETIYIWTARGKEILPNEENPKKRVLARIVENGFEKPDAFYTPKYTTFQSTTFEHLGVIHWEPEVTITQNGMASFNILDTGKDEVVLFIEGMSKDGQLVSFSKVLNLNPEP